METDQTLQDIIASYFKPNDFVRVINIDTEPFEWKYCADEEVFQDQIYRRVITRKVDTYRLEPGESQVLEGGCARIMVEALFKKVAPKRESLKHKALGINAIQRKYLDEIVVGTENPFAKPIDANAPIEVAATPQQLEKQVEQEFADVIETKPTVEIKGEPATSKK